MIPTCPYCGTPAELVTGAVIYPHRPDLHDRNFWHCEPCDAYVGCHQRARGRRGMGDGTVPLGRLANAELRRAKQDAHAAFDPLWKKGSMSRGAAYGWLSEAIGIPEDQCHIGMLDVAGCRAVVTAVRSRREAA